MLCLVPGFNLDKWYFDLVTPSGQCWIGYCARLELGPLRLTCAMELTGGPERVARGRRSLVGAGWPCEAGGGVSWRCDALKTDGGWQGMDPAFERTLLRTSRGEVVWRSAVPRGRALLKVGGTVLEGLGHCERMSLSMAPWALPITVLHWGRWHSDEGSLVWIRWEGAQPLTLVLRDGAEVLGCSVAPGRVGGDGWELSLDRSTVLRDGPLGRTVLDGIPGLDRLAPAAMLGTTETKWLSRARMSRLGQEPVEGWAIHELVRMGGAEG